MAVDIGVSGAFALDHKAQRARCMAVAFRHFAGLHQLNRHLKRP